jgi:hypothetical protein
VFFLRPCNSWIIRDLRFLLIFLFIGFLFFFASFAQCLHLCPLRKLFGLIVKTRSHVICLNNAFVFAFIYSPKNSYSPFPYLSDICLKNSSCVLRFIIPHQTKTLCYFLSNHFTVITSFYITTKCFVKDACMVSLVSLPRIPPHDMPPVFYNQARHEIQKPNDGYDYVLMVFQPVHHINLPAS